MIGLEPNFRKKLLRPTSCRSFVVGGAHTRRLDAEDAKLIAMIFFTEPRKPSHDDAFGIICQALEHGMKNRVLGITANGYLRVLPAQARKGDYITVMSGCSLPVVLRTAPNDNNDNEQIGEFIGECYVYEFMNGEAVEIEKNGQLASEHITLI